MRHLIVSAVALVAVVAGSLTASAGEGRRVVYKRAAQPVAVKQVAQTKVADLSVAELQARIAELTKRVQALESAAAESRRQITTLSTQLDQAVQPTTRPVSARVNEPTIIISEDLFPNEYPYGG